MTARLVVFSDIDGTLIDSATYSVATTAPTATSLLSKGIPLILCSSKTSAEQRYYRAQLGIEAPYIAENGSAIFVPTGYFPVDPPHTRAENGYVVQELGTAVAEIRAKIARVKQETGLAWQGLNDLPLAEISQRTGMSPTTVALAQQREYSETILTPLGVAEIHTLRSALADQGLALLIRESFHLILSAQSDEGTAVSWLSDHYRQMWSTIETVGLGNSANDADMLAAVHRPYLVQKAGGGWHSLPPGVAANLVNGIGPAGWQQAVTDLLANTVER
jgi:mannosyl-3-phosphoglycerate phosphatase